MKAFLWHDIERVSSNYHPGGSVLIEAMSIEMARELALKSYIKGAEKEPDATFVSSSEVEKIWVFPDAGCC